MYTHNISEETATLDELLREAWLQHEAQVTPSKENVARYVMQTFDSHLPDMAVQRIDSAAQSEHDANCITVEVMLPRTNPTVSDQLNGDSVAIARLSFTLSPDRRHRSDAVTTLHSYRVAIDASEYFADIDGYLPMDRKIISGDECSDPMALAAAIADVCYYIN